MIASISAHDALDLIGLVALVVSGIAIGGNRALWSMVKTARENVATLEEARQIDRDQCARELEELRTANRTLAAKITALEANYAAEITKLVLEALTKQVEVFGRNLQAGQDEIVNRLETIRVAVGSRGDDSKGP